MVKLSRLMQPKSLAVMGGRWAENVVVNCQAIGFEGPMWAVHPHKDNIAGVPAYPSVEHLPDAPDLSFLAINRHACIEAIAQLSAMNAGGAICFASGFAEAGDLRLQQQLIIAAGDMPVLGPNCYGYLNYCDNLALWPDQHGGKSDLESGVAIFSQSSNIAINLTMQSRGLPIAQIMCLGNQAMITLQDLAYEALHDNRISALGFYIEGIQHPDQFAELVYRARCLNKPVVVIKSGLSLAGQMTTVSHTASLAGSGAASIAFLKQCGAVVADSLEEFLELLKLAHLYGENIRAENFCSVSCSGGEAALMADLFDKHNVPCPKPSLTTSQKLHTLLGDLVKISNPLDYHTFIWGEQKKITRMLRLLIADYDILLMVIDFPRLDRCDQTSFMPAVEAIIEAQKNLKKPILPLISLTENIDENLLSYFLAHNITCLCGLQTGLLASKKFFCRSQAPSFWQPFADNNQHTDQYTTLSEFEGKIALQDYSTEVPQSVYAKNLKQLRTHCALPPKPWVVKGMGFDHKTEAGAVQLNVGNLDDILPIHQASGYLLEEMITGTVAEILLCVRREPVYGISLTIGQGGVLTELYAETQTLLLPLSKEDIHAALKRLRLYALLEGYRGQPQANIDALVTQITRLCGALQENPRWQEIEVNPLLVTSEKAVCADVLITYRQ